jgi:O-antigen ligase
MLPHLSSVENARLGEIVVEGTRLGNPVQLGIPLALSFLALSLDKGRWVSVQGRQLYRVGLLGCVTILLALTTSRAGWLVAVSGFAVALVLGAGQRARMVATVFVVGLAVQGLRLTSFDESFEKGVERTLGGDRSLTNRTSGRSEQWVVAYYAFSESVGSVLYGYGPGRGAEIYAIESLRVPDIEFMAGQKMELHSLIMQVGVETGLAGLVPLAVGMLLACYRSVRWRDKSVFPAVCLSGYLAAIATVSGNDMSCGVLLGIGLLASARRATKEPATRPLMVRRALQRVNDGDEQ